MNEWVRSAILPMAQGALKPQIRPPKLMKNEMGSYAAKQGTFVNIPFGGIVHRFTNKQDKPARIWCTVVPSGIDAMFLELGKPGQLLPPPQLSPDDLKHMQEVAEKYGRKLYPPDFLHKK